MGDKKYYIAADDRSRAANCWFMLATCMHNYQLKLGMLQSMCVKYDMMCTCELGAFQLKILAVSRVFFKKIISMGTADFSSQPGFQ